MISKLYPTRSHTGAAQGGIGAALGNLEEDHPIWHAFDTVKGSDYLGDQDAIEIMCEEAGPRRSSSSSTWGCPSPAPKDGLIAQRPFGGHTHHYGEGPVRRSCYAADRTGHMILQTLYQNCIKSGVDFYDEFQVVDLFIHDGRCGGVVAWHVDSGRAAHLPREGDALRDWRLRAHLVDHLERLRQHRRWTRNRSAPG